MKDFGFSVISNRETAPGVYAMDLSCQSPEFFRGLKPGQFLHIRTPDESLNLRRPISICDADPEKGRVRIVYAVKGAGTRALAKAAAGDGLFAIGPLGNGFPVDVTGGVLLLGGGIGIAPLFYTAKALLQEGAKVTAYLGYRSRENMFLLEEFQRLGCGVRCYTDDGSFGEKGFAVAGLLKELQEETVMACGPSPMFKALKTGLVGDNPCYISLEERMGCGVGACLVCACRIMTADGERAMRVCADGPVFSAREVIL